MKSQDCYIHILFFFPGGQNLKKNIFGKTQWDMKELRIDVNFKSKAAVFNESPIFDQQSSSVTL